MRSFIYCRVSTREQGSADHYSLDNQEQRCRDYLAMKKWRLGKVRKDIASGKSDERAGFQELIASIRDGRIDVVLVYRLDRLSRNVRDIYDFLESIKDSGVAFVSVTEGFDTTTAMGRAMLGVAAVFAQLTREMIAENTKDGLMRRGEAGLFNGNKVNLYGYSYSKELGLIVHENEALQIKQIFEWYGEHKWGVDKIARMLNLEGQPAKNGGQWGAERIATILRNRVYCGEVRANGGYVPGQQAPIIPLDQFEAVQSMIESRTVLPSRSQDSPHLLSGIARCGTCGRRLRIHSTKRDANGIKRDYYLHKPDVTVGDSSCPGISVNGGTLEAAVVAEVLKLSQSNVMERLVIRDVQQRTKKQHVPMLKVRDKLLIELEQLADKFTRWADRLDAGRIQEEQFDRQNQRLMARQNELQKQLTVLDTELNQAERVEVTLRQVKDVLANFEVVWHSLEFEERREALRLLIEELKIYRSHVELKPIHLEPVRFKLAGSRRRKGARQLPSLLPATKG